MHIKKVVVGLVFSFLLICCEAQVNDIKGWQNELNAEYSDKLKSPLEKNDRENFAGHTFFPVDVAYQVMAKLDLSTDTTIIRFKTSTSKLALNRLYGILHFKLNGKNYQLNVYQSSDLLKVPGYEDYLFLPFTDLTTGNQTYGGGRYIDLRIPKSGDTVTIDFNKAYNPYCAYSNNYSCPKVPSENDLNIKVLAGVKLNKRH